MNPCETNTFKSTTFLCSFTTTCVCVSERSANHCGCTTDAGADSNRRNRTVPCTSPTFHAIVSVNNLGFAIINCKDCMWAYCDAYSAARTFFLAKLQGHHVCQILGHSSLLLFIRRNVPQPTGQFPALRPLLAQVRQTAFPGALRKAMYRSKCRYSSWP